MRYAVVIELSRYPFVTPLYSLVLLIFSTVLGKQWHFDSFLMHVIFNAKVNVITIAIQIAYIYLELVALAAALYNSWSETARNG